MPAEHTQKRLGSKELAVAQAEAEAAAELAAQQVAELASWRSGLLSDDNTFDLRLGIEAVLGETAGVRVRLEGEAREAAMAR